ncbi:MAG: YARHG domain-containing protein [Ruminococcus sp.]|nr:YARHG domain-containing protein [Ruminococcus sp.]
MDDRKERDGYESYEDYDDDDNEETEKEGVGTGIKVAFGIIITLIVLLSAAVGLVLFGDSFGFNVKSLFVQETTAAPTEMPTAAPVTTAEPTTQALTYSVPYVVGMTAKDAYYELNESGVKYSIKREYSETVKAEAVLGQEPESGYVTGDENVIIIISKGVDQPDTTVPPTTNGDKRKEKEKVTTAPASGDYLLNNSDKRIIERSEVENMSEKQITYALNELYARRGRKFKSADLQAYFNSKSWYKGTIEPSQFDESSLNQYEKANVQIILSVMREKGYR